MGEIDWTQELTRPISPGESSRQDWWQELAPAAPIRQVTKDRLRIMLQPSYTTDVAREAIPEAFPTSFMPAFERPGEMGSVAGELTGSAAAALTGPFAPVARPVFAGIGAGVGSQAERLARGEPLDPQQMINEAILSFVPEFAESAIRGISRGIARLTRGGQDLRLDEAARIARRGGQRVFQPPERREVQQLFELLNTYEVKNPMRGTINIIQALNASEQKRIMKELQRLDALATSALTDDTVLLSPKQLQNYRSLIGQQAESLRTSGRAGAARTRQILLEIQRAVDQDIDDILEQVDLGGAAQTAREAYHRVKSAERLERIITTSPITKSTQGGDIYQFHLDRLDNLLKDQRTRDARALVSALNKIPGARQEFDRFRAEIKAIVPERVLEISDVSGLRRLAPVAVIDRMLSFLLTHPQGQQIFRQAVIYGRGRLSVNQLAIIVNTVRRSMVGVGEPEVYIAPGAVSGRGPAGLAIPPGALRPQPPER